MQVNIILWSYSKMAKIKKTSKNRSWIICEKRGLTLLTAG